MNRVQKFGLVLVMFGRIRIFQFFALISSFFGGFRWFDKSGAQIFKNALSRARPNRRNAEDLHRGAAKRQRSVFRYCALTHLAEPVNLTATSEKKIRIGLPSARVITGHSTGVAGESQALATAPQKGRLVGKISKRNLAVLAEPCLSGSGLILLSETENRALQPDILIMLRTNSKRVNEYSSKFSMENTTG